MKFLDAIRGALATRRTGIPSVADWHLYVEERTVTDIDFRRGRLGGPYAPPSIREETEAHLFVRWGDGRASRTLLNRAHLAQADALPHFLYSAAYPEPCPDYIPGPFVPADLRVRDPVVEDAVRRDPSPLFPPVECLADGLEDLKDDEVRGGLSATLCHRHLHTSRGAEADYASTTVSLGIDLGSRAFISRSIRSLPDEDTLGRMLVRVRSDYEHLDRPFSGDVDDYPVLLAAPLVERFMGWFMLRNLSMQAIHEGASAFTREQLESGARLFHPSLDIVDRPDRDHHPGAFRFCSRGRAPFSRPLVAGGKLVAADVSLRAAAKTGVPPSPTSHPQNWILGGDRMDVEGDIPERIESVLGGVERALFVYAVLGLHTQDPTRGAYSLGVPRALVIHDGRVRGYVRGTLIGNFFDDLKRAPAPIADPVHDGVILPVAARFRVS